MDETPEKKTRTRKPKVQFPVEALVWLQGQKGPRAISALWVRKDVGCITFGLPEFERPFMLRTLRIPDTSGAVVELLEMQLQQQQGAPSAHASREDLLRHAADVLNHPGPSAESAVTAAFGNRPLRSRVAEGLPPVSEAVDEAGNPVIVKAAFGLMPTT